MKKCIGCGEIKNLDCFYKHKQMKDGRLNKCKSCVKVDVKKNREVNIDYYKEYDRKRANDPKRVEMRRKYGQTEAGLKSKSKSKKKYIEKNKDKVLEKQRIYRKLNQKKVKAQEAVLYNIKIGNLKRGFCEICGKEKTEGHHDDYNKPLSVRWLCSKHHREWHKINGEGKNGN